MVNREKGAWHDRGFTFSLLSLSTLVVIAGCARNHMTSVANPFAVRPYSKLMVYVPSDDPRLRQVTEEEFASVGGTNLFVPASQVPFPAQRNHQDEETQQLFAQNGIEGDPGDLHIGPGYQSDSDGAVAIGRLSVKALGPGMCGASPGRLLLE